MAAFEQSEMSPGTRNELKECVLGPESGKYVTHVKKIPEKYKLSADEIMQQDFYRYLRPAMYNSGQNPGEHLFSIYGSGQMSAKDMRETMLFYGDVHITYFQQVAKDYLESKGLDFKVWQKYMSNEKQRGDELAIFATSVAKDIHTLVLFKGGMWSTMRGYEDKSFEYMYNKCNVVLVYLGLSFYLKLVPRLNVWPKTTPCCVKLVSVEQTHRVQYLKAKYNREFDIPVTAIERTNAEIALFGGIYKIEQEMDTKEVPEKDKTQQVPYIFRVPRVDGRLHCPEDKCDKSYLKKQDLNRHMLRHNAEKVQCSECEYSSSDPRLMKLHKARHSDILPYVCTKCKKAFKHAMQLYRHHEKEEC